ncbi:MAG TPA: hypothetical protein PKK06_16340 [Phycisphaerae bacterium]|nr:hypothetical protein [Phycisphaerae bacterium]HNU46811.1 hypothetical protein [Phycisphaerae bacterium]
MNANQRKPRATRVRERPDLGDGVWEYTDGAIRGSRGKLVRGTLKYPGAGCRRGSKRTGIAALYDALMGIAAELAEPENLPALLRRLLRTDDGLWKVLDLLRPLVLRYHDEATPVTVEHIIAIGPPRDAGPPGFDAPTADTACHATQFG